MESKPPFGQSEKRFAWALAILGGVVALIAQLTRPDTGDIDELIGALGLVFAVIYLILLGVSILVARRLLSSVAWRILTMVAGPPFAMVALAFLTRLAS